MISFKLCILYIRRKFKDWFSRLMTLELWIVSGSIIYSNSLSLLISFSKFGAYTFDRLLPKYTSPLLLPLLCPQRFIWFRYGRVVCSRKPYPQTKRWILMSSSQSWHFITLPSSQAGDGVLATEIKNEVFSGKEFEKFSIFRKDRRPGFTLILSVGCLLLKLWSLELLQRTWDDGRRKAKIIVGPPTQRSLSMKRQNSQILIFPFSRHSYAGQSTVVIA